jgi:biopolymer transport protein ExbB
MKNIFILILFLAGSLVLHAKDQTQESNTSFIDAAESIQGQLEESLSELTKLREQISSETIPLSRKLSDLEAELVNVRLEYQQTSRLLDSRTLDLSNLRSEIKSRQDEATYLSNLLSEYIGNFESRLHIVEIQRYRDQIEAAKLAPENTNLSEQEVYEAQAKLLVVSLERLFDALGGTRFDGTASDSSGSIHHGTFVLIGPSAIFQSDDGSNIGVAEQRLGSLEPTVIAFGNPADSNEAAQVISDSAGLFPLDPTLGNAHKIESTNETILEHIQKGGQVMYPIFALAGVALLVALFKWLSLAFIRKPSKRRISALLNAVAEHDEETAKNKVKTIKGPIGKMLYSAVEHIKEPPELIEEVMYEKVLATRLKLERFLPFIAISAASAPLLGLLGTVTGIINTFKLITVFGSGDVKTLSGGISEALITTEFGLIVAIPSLLLHAFLSRKARRVVNEMEKVAVAFVNQVSKTPYQQNKVMDILTNPTVSKTEDILQNNYSREQSASPRPVREHLKDSAASLMNRMVVSVFQTDTVAEALDKIRTAEIDADIDTVFIVDEQGKYTGQVLFRHLLIRPEQARVESLPDKKRLFVRIDTRHSEIRNIFRKHDLVSVPVLDYNDRLLGQINRNGEEKER